MILGKKKNQGDMYKFHTSKHQQGENWGLRNGDPS